MESTPKRHGSWRRRLAAGVGLAALVVLVALNVHACRAPLVVGELAPDRAAPRVDEHVELARRYAPWVFHAVHPTRGRQDLPAAVDFDGDLDGGNNWESFARHELVPTLSYAVLETETHWFLTWHVFHPRDWSVVDLGLHMTHEGDGENLQVVVEKASGRPVLLFTQAHYCGGVYTNAGSGFEDGEESVRGELVLLDDEGRPSADGTHAAVFVESGGHGIYGLADVLGDEVEREPDGRFAFRRAGLVLRPARPGEAPREPALDATEPVPYRLDSTVARLWPLLRDGSLVGEGRLLDGAVPFASASVETPVPRFHEGDRFSGPFGPDRGISPFAVDFGWRTGTLGALFFEPARRYAECLTVPEPWSLVWVDYPFADAAESR